MEALSKLAIVLSFYLFRVYRCHFLWPDIEAFNGVKCSLISTERKRKHDSQVDKVQFILGSVAIVSFMVNSFFLVSFGIGLLIFISGLIGARRARIVLGASWANIFELTEQKQPLVTVGPYRWCRNPIYVAFFVEWVGFIITFAWHILDEPIFWIVLLVGAIIMMRSYHQAILLEEHKLSERYGNDYKNYAAITPRYLPLGPLLQLLHKPKPIF